jgi:putative NADH-flavin reductase
MSAPAAGFFSVSSAAAMVDEVEQHAHSRQRFTAGY